MMSADDCLDSTGISGGMEPWWRKGWRRAAAKLAGVINPNPACPARPAVSEAAAANRGLWDILIFSISASCIRLDFARRFWNQIFTCVSVRFKLFENSARSAMDRYCFSRNFFSKAVSCCVVNGVRGFRFGLCFLKVQRRGPRASCSPDPGSRNIWI